jgi:hypothetical protein
MRMTRLLALSLTPLLLTSCIAYSVGTTARPVPKGEFQPNLSAYFIPNGIERVDNDGDTNKGLAYASADFEGRWGLSDRSDLALRTPGGSGAIVSYKRLLNGVNDPERMAVSSIVGAGIVNFGNHAYMEGGLIASGRESRRVPYGGVRVMHVLPISSGAVSDTPTAGVFGGVRMRIGDNFSISPELGVYYDKSALELRTRNVVFIPSLTFHWD